MRIMSPGKREQPGPAKHKPKVRWEIAAVVILCYIVLSTRKHSCGALRSEYHLRSNVAASGVPEFEATQHSFAGSVGAYTSSAQTSLATVVLHAHPAPSQPLEPDTPVTYAHYYRDERTRPSACRIAHKPNRPFNGSSGYVPFIGTSIGLDPQHLSLRLYYSTLDYPVKYFVVVIPERALLPPHGAWYEVQHLKEYADNVVIVTCADTPSVAEGWNAVFQAFPDEAWGVYCARDTAWMPGALQKLAGHMWTASRDNSIEVALMNWTYPISGGLYTAFGLTRAALGRFGLFDENIYPAFFEDIDFQVRQTRMQPPMEVQVLPDVIMQRGKQIDQSYNSGVHMDDLKREQQGRSFWQRRAHINKAYVLRKWGCQGRDFGGCRYKTPFNKSLPTWYWHTSRYQRALDQGLTANGTHIIDGEGNAVYEVPKDDNYIEWAGYNESAHACRITGPLGIVLRSSSGLWCM